MWYQLQVILLALLQQQIVLSSPETTQRVFLKRYSRSERESIQFQEERNFSKMTTTPQLPHPHEQHRHRHHHHHHHHQQQQDQHHAVDLRLPAIEKYAYCLCLHVKPTTIFIAVFKLIRALLSASIILNAEFPVNDQTVNNELNLTVFDDRHKSTLAAEHILTRIVVASVSAVGIYAVISSRAALLMPLYAMLLVDFFFALPAFYNRDIDSSFSDGFSDFKNYTPNGHTQHTRYSFVLFTTTTMIIKIYFLCVIWKCYRYLRLIELVSPIRLGENYPHMQPLGLQYPVVRVLGSADSTDFSTNSSMAPPPYESITSNMKPPNYEEAIKTSATVLPMASPLSAPSPVAEDQQQQTNVVSIADAHDESQQLQGDDTLTQVVSHPSVGSSEQVSTCQNSAEQHQPEDSSQRQLHSAGTSSTRCTGAPSSIENLQDSTCKPNSDEDGSNNKSLEPDKPSSSSNSNNIP